MGNSLTHKDGHAGGHFDYLLANPPFGVDWKKYAAPIQAERDALGLEGRYGAGESEILDRALAVDPATFERSCCACLRPWATARPGGSSTPGSPVTPASTASLPGPARAGPHIHAGQALCPRQRGAATGDPGERVWCLSIGALFGAQGDRGVFITTSIFSAGARQEAERVKARIVLIDGDRLAELMGPPRRRRAGRVDRCAAPCRRGLLRHALNVAVLQGHSPWSGVAVVDRFTYNRTHDRQALAGPHLGS